MDNQKFYQICTNCVMDTTNPNIEFDEKGVCQSCNQYYDDILPSWNKGEGKEETLKKIIEKIKNYGRGKEYNCILGLSGGLDSSYMLHFAVKELGLRPLVFHVDAGWNYTFTEDNIKKMIAKLGVELKVDIINWNEIRDMQLAFFKSGVPHLDTPQDHVFVSVLDKYAAKHNIKYILNGGNISTEVISNPYAWGYWGTDSRQIKDILSKYGSIPMKEYPFTSIFRRKLYMPYIKKVKVINLLNYIPYVKKDAEELLTLEYNWTPYIQKHFENILTKFIEGYWTPKRFGTDIRRPQFSSLILTEQMTREEALKKLMNPPLSEEEENELLSQVASKLKISNEELKSYFDMPLRTYRNYKNQEYIFKHGAKILYWLKLDKLIRN